MLAKLNKLTNWQAAIIIAVIGFAVFFTGLTTSFQGDDLAQIVDNIPVHSITHIKLFFEGGTFYEGNGIAPLGGSYFRPLMTVVFSLLYTIFGAHPFYFHLFQLLLCMGSAIILYLFFRYSFKPPLALFLSLIFLVHPLDSQVVYAIPSMQDALFFFFGILAFYLLIRLNTIRSLLLVVMFLFLSLLAKETAILFVAMALVYLFWWDRKRLIWFMGAIVLPIALWLALRIHAIGLNSNPHNAPIDSLGIGGRLMTAPSIGLLYIVKFIFPWKLATSYYWVYPTFSISHFLVPLVADLAVVATMVYVAFILHRKAPKDMYYMYLFFAIWSVLGCLTFSQVLPLDMTACETWVYFTMAGVLGMIGVAISVLVPPMPRRLNRRTLFIVALIILVLLGVRTAVRGAEWGNPIVLDKHDIEASQGNYVAESDAASYYLNHGNYKLAATYAKESVAILPDGVNSGTLGQAYAGLGNYPAAAVAYVGALKFRNDHTIYEDIGALTLVYGNSTSNRQFLLIGLHKYPQSAYLWFDLAILDENENDNAEAKLAISQAMTYGSYPQAIYDSIMQNKPFTLAPTRSLPSTINVQ